MTTRVIRRFWRCEQSVEGYARRCYMGKHAWRWTKWSLPTEGSIRWFVSPRGVTVVSSHGGGWKSLHLDDNRLRLRCSPHHDPIQPQLLRRYPDSSTSNGATILHTYMTCTWTSTTDPHLSPQTRSRDGLLLPPPVTRLHLNTFYSTTRDLGTRTRFTTAATARGIRG